MTENQSTEVVISSNDYVGQLNAGAPQLYSSFKSDDFETKKKVYAALSSPEKVDEHLGKKIDLANVIVQKVEIADEKTGELSEAPRVILIDDKGKAYVGTSEGLLRAVKNIIGILGEPHTWPAPVAVKVVEAKSRRGFKFFTIELG